MYLRNFCETRMFSWKSFYARFRNYDNPLATPINCCVTFNRCGKPFNCSHLKQKILNLCLTFFTLQFLYRIDLSTGLNLEYFWVLQVFWSQKFASINGDFLAKKFCIESNGKGHKTLDQNYKCTWENWRNLPF